VRRAAPRLFHRMREKGTRVSERGRIEIMRVPQVASLRLKFTVNRYHRIELRRCRPEDRQRLVGAEKRGEAFRI